MRAQADIGTRTRLIDVAERLFAEQGIAGVSLRTIGSRAGQRNNSVTHYHFGSKQRLIEAVVETRSVPIEARRAALVDELLAAEAEFTVQELVRVLIAPLAESIEDRARTHYLRFLASVMADPDVREALDPLRGQPASVRWIHQRLRELLPGLSRADFQRRLEWGVMFSLQALADHERRRHTGTAGPEKTAGTLRELVAAQAALLECPAED